MNLKIVTLTGHKHTKKDYIAKKLAENSDVTYIQPYTDKPLVGGISREEAGGHHFISKEEMDYLLKREELLAMTKIVNTRYCFFKFQLQSAYNVLIADDYAVVDIKNKYDNVFTVRVVSDNEEESDRVGEYLYKHEFDYVFDVDKDDFNELEALICYEEP